MIELGIFDAFKTFSEKLIFVSPEEGYIRGNSRRYKIEDSVELLRFFDYQDLLFGQPGSSPCCTPIEPIINRGIFGSWPYYLILSIFIIYSFIKKNIIALAIALMLMQRPEIQSAGTSFLVAALLFVYKFNHFFPKNLNR